MSDTAQILSAAAALGETLARHPKVALYVAAEARFQADAAAQQVLKDYEHQAQHMHEREQAQRPIEVADKRRLAELKAAVAANDTLKELLRTQVDYVDIMNQVQRAMQDGLMRAATRQEQR